jgi:hypothetical protein
MYLKEIGWTEWTGFIWIGKGTGEHDNEPPGPIKGGEYLDQLNVVTTSQLPCCMELVI